MYQSWKQTNALDTYVRASRISNLKVGQEINMKRDVVRLFVWNGICQCKKDCMAKAVPARKSKV